MTDIVLSPWGPHYAPLRELDDVGTVDTPGMRRVRLRTIEACRDRTLLVVTGSVGSGKSFGLGRACEAAVATFGLVVVWMELATSASERALLEDLYIRITGVDPPKRVRAADLRRLLHRVLADEPRLLVVDEAQHASPMALRNLRWLHDKLSADFAIVVSGLPEVWKTLPPEMRSRAGHHVRLDRLADADAPGFLKRFHPFFADVDPGLLIAMNRTFAKGSYRWWGKLLASGIHLAESGKLLNDDNLFTYIADMEDG